VGAMTVWEVLALLCGSVLLVGVATVLSYVVGRQTPASVLRPRPSGFRTIRTKVSFAFPLLIGIAVSAVAFGAYLADATVLGSLLCLVCSSFLVFLAVMGGFLLSERKYASDATTLYQGIGLDRCGEAQQILFSLLAVMVFVVIVMAIPEKPDPADLHNMADAAKAAGRLKEAKELRDRAWDARTEELEEEEREEKVAREGEEAEERMVEAERRHGLR